MTRKRDADLTAARPQLSGRASGNDHVPSEDFRSRAEETYRVIPSGRDRQAVRDLAVAAAELDGDGTIRTLPCRDAVHRIGVVRVRLEVTLAVVDGQGPETVDRH